MSFNWLWVLTRVGDSARHSGTLVAGMVAAKPASGVIVL